MLQGKRKISYAVYALLLCASSLFSEQRGIAVTGTAQQANPSGIMPGTLTVAMGHGEEIKSLSFSPDGKYLATCSKDKTIKLWNMETGQELWTFTGKDVLQVVKYNPDGNYIAAGTSGKLIYIIDAKTGVQVNSFELKNTLDDMVYSPDGVLLYTTMYQSCYVYEAISGKIMSIFPLFTGDEQIRCVALSPDGKTLITGGNQGTLVICDAGNGAITAKLNRAHEHYLQQICFSPDGALFASGSFQDDHNVKIWSAAGKLQQTIDTFESNIVGLSFSADGKYLAMIDNFSNYKLYNTKSKRLEQEMEMTDVGSLSACLSFVPTGNVIAVAGYSKVVVIWDVLQNKAIKRLEGSADAVQTVAYRHDDKQIAIGSSYPSKTVGLWDVSTGELKQTVAVDDLQESLAYNTDKTLLLKSDAIMKFDPVTGGETAFNATCSGKFAVSADGAICAAASSKVIEVLDIPSNTIIQTIKQPFMEQDVDEIAIHPKGTLIAAAPGFSLDTTGVKVWDTHGKLITTIDGFQSVVNCLAFSPNGKYLYALDLFGNAKTWDVQSQKVVQAFKLSKELPNSTYNEVSGLTTLTVSPDGRFIAIGNQSSIIMLFSADEFPRNPCIILAHKGQINSLAFSSDGKRLLSGSRDGTAKVWDTATGKCLVTMLQATNGEWLTWTDEGYYCGSEWAAKNLVYFVSGRDVIGIDQMYDTLYRPDLVAAKLAGENISGYMAKAAVSASASNEATSKLPPDVSVEQLPASTDKRDITVEIRATDNGGGIGAVNLLLNGKVFPVATAANSKKGDTLSFKYLITVQNGKNAVVAQAYNREGTIVSQSPEKTVSWAGGTEKPRLFVLAIAANKYRAQGLQLRYSIADADGIIAALQSSSGNLYRDTIVKKVYDAEVTMAGITGAFDELANQVQADDVFVFYLAGHGVTYDEDGDYYYLPVTFRYTEKSDIPAQGISKKTIMQNLAKIKAGKSIVLMDTCSSGTFVAGTRSGLSEATAINRLTRATGSATIAAGSDQQVAMEGYNGHGIFTYVLMDGLSGKADVNKDGFITLQELCSYAEYEVPELSYEKWGYEQVPQKHLRDQDFPIGTSK